MVDISRLSRLIDGVQRQVDLSTNTLVVDKVKFGGGAGTDLSKTILDNLIALQNGTDFATGTNSHTHDGRYYTETELGAQTDGASGASKIGIDVTPAFSNFTSGNNVQSALEGIDAALSSGDGKVKISAADTTSQYLGASIVAGSALTSTILNPGVNETLSLDVAVDGSTIEVNTDALRVKDLGITAAKLAADSVITVKILDANVTNVKIAAGIDAAKLADGTVSNAEFQFINSVTSNVQTQLDAKVAKAGSSMDSAANITFSGGGEVLGLPATPSVAGAAASKAYVDAVAVGLTPKKAVRVATTVTGTLATSFENGDTIDGVVLATTDRILIKNQSTASENGIYTVNVSGAPTRATDMDSLSPIDEVNGAWVPVQFGTQAGQIFVQYGLVSTLGVDALNFEFYNPIASLIGGDMITVSGSTISIDLATASGLESTIAADAAGQLRVKLETSTPSLKFTGSNELAVKLNAAGAIASGASGLAAQVDGSTIEIATNALQVKDLGISTAKLAATSVTAAKLGNDVAGAGLSGGNGSALTVAYSPSVQAAGEIAGESFSATTLYAVRYGQNAETTGRMYKADNDATTTDNFHVIGLALTVGALSAAGTMPNVYKMGLITVTAHGFTVGKPVWLGASGALTSTTPSTASLADVKIGMVKDANTIDVQIQVMGVN